MRTKRGDVCKMFSLFKHMLSAQEYWPFLVIDIGCDHGHSGDGDGQERRWCDIKKINK